MLLEAMKQDNPQAHNIKIESCQNVEIRFAGCPYAKEDERQSTFISSFDKNKLFIVGHIIPNTSISPHY